MVEQFTFAYVQLVYLILFIDETTISFSLTQIVMFYR